MPLAPGGPRGEGKLFALVGKLILGLLLGPTWFNRLQNGWGRYSHKSTMRAPLFAKVYMVHHACFMIQGFKSTRFKLVPFQKNWFLKFVCKILRRDISWPLRATLSPFWLLWTSPGLSWPPLATPGLPWSLLASPGLVGLDEKR